MGQFFTVGEIAERLSQPAWKVRRAVDGLGRRIPRAGQYRVIPVNLLETIARHLGVTIAEPAKGLPHAD